MLEEHQEEKIEFKIRPLLFTTLIISGCSMIYELIIGSLGSYLLGNSVVQFSLTIGIYLFAMGVGSYGSKFIHQHLFDYFASLEVIVGLLGSFSSIILFLCYIYTDIYSIVMYGLTFGIGFFVGLEIPLLVRIIEQHDKVLKDELANLFAFDYIGGLLGSLAFPLLLLPQFGYITVAFITGILNILAASVIVFKYDAHLKWKKSLKTVIVASLIVIVSFIFFGNRLTNFLEGGLYEDQVIFSKQTLYQKIVVTKHKDDLRVFLDGNTQFSSIDEKRYHEALVHIPVGLTGQPKKVLLLGAGDGLAARELLKYSSIEKITLVDLDEEMVELCRTNPEISKLNEQSLDNPKVELVYEDAFTFLEKNKELYQVVIADLPDPNNESLNKLYTTSFYRLINRSLTEEGIMVTQSNSPLFTGNAFWCINKTLKEEFPYVVPYHLYVPSFGDWGYNLASKTKIEPAKIKLDQLDLSYLNEQTLPVLFSFAEDEKKDLAKLEINTLFKPKLFEYYDSDTSKL